MSLIIIGEAATKVMDGYLEFTHAHPEVPWPNMRGMRKHIAHGYFEWKNLNHVRYDAYQTGRNQTLNVLSHYDRLVVCSSDGQLFRTAVVTIQPGVGETYALTESRHAIKAQIFQERVVAIAAGRWHTVAVSQQGALYQAGTTQRPGLANCSSPALRALPLKLFSFFLILSAGSQLWNIQSAFVFEFLLTF